MRHVWKLIVLSILLALSMKPQPGFAHALSAGFTDVRISDKQTELTYSIDSLSVIEGFPIDTNEDGLLDEDELKHMEHRVEEWIEDSLIVEKDRKQQAGEVKSLKLEQKGDKQVVTIRFVYPGFQQGETISIIDGLLYKQENSANYANFLTASYQGQTNEMALQGTNRTWTMILTDEQQQQGPGTTEREAAPSAWQSFFKLGMEHILTGYDHLLFLLALLLRKQTVKQYIATVTAFTLAHSITLSLAVLNIIHLPSRFVEAIIALSICYVAIENIWRKEVKHRWVVTFLFGLVHGFGFATILQEMPITKSHLAAALLNFNLGIEAVQVLLVLLLIWPLHQLHRLAKARHVVNAGSGLIFLLGAVWLVQRLFG